MNWAHSLKRASLCGLIAVLLTSLKSFAVLRILSPEEVGIWKSAMLLFLVAALVRLGVARGMSLQVPLLRGQERNDEVERVASASGFFLFQVGLVTAAMALVGAAAISGPRWKIAVASMAGVLLLAQVHQFLRELAIANQLQQLRSRELILGAVVDCVGGLLLAYWFGLAGLGVATMLAIAVPALYLWRNQKLPKAYGWDGKRVRELVRLGLPSSMLDASFNAARYADVLVLTPMLGAVAVGHYSISLLVNDLALFVTRVSVFEIISPNLMKEYGRTGLASDAAAVYEEPAQFFSYVLPPVLGVASFWLPSVVALLLPAYQPGAAAGQITVWGCYFLALNASVSAFLVASGKIQTALRLFLLSVPLAAGLHGGVITLGLGLEGVATVSAGVLGLITFSQLWMCRRAAGSKVRPTCEFLMSLAFPLLAAIALWATIRDAVASPASQSVILLFMYLPVVVVYEARFGLIRRILWRKKERVGRVLHAG